MSRIRALGSVLVVTAALTVSPSGAGAQQTVEELEARIETLWPQIQQARGEALEAERRYLEARARANPATLDTIQVGPLTVVTPPEQVETARAMYGRIWEEEYAPFVDHSPSLDQVMFTFQWAPELVKITMNGEHYRAEGTLWRGRAHHEGLIRESIGRALSKDLEDTRLHSWVRDALRTPENWDWVYRRLAMTPSAVARRCISGTPDSCWAALGIDAEVGAYLDWYTAEERRLLVKRYFRGYRREESAQFEACLDDGILEQCDAILAEIFERFPQSSYRYLVQLAPLGWSERITMVWTAVNMGGEGAWDRLVEDPEMPVGEALLYASGATRAELEAAWRADVLAHRPETHADLGTMRWTALFWILLLGALAMRSTRWRLA